jgi:hypothetical protein
MLNNSGGRVRDLEVFAIVKDRREEARRMISGEIDISLKPRNDSTCTWLKQKTAGGTLSILTKVSSIT